MIHEIQTNEMHDREARVTIAVIMIRDVIRLFIATINSNRRAIIIPAINIKDVIVTLYDS